MEEKDSREVADVKKDEGYSWFVVTMSMLSHLCHLGFGYGVVGNLTVVHKEVFDIGLQESSLIGSLFIATLYIFSPASALLVKTLGCRRTEFLGGGFMILGLGLSSLSTESWHAFLLFAVVTGVGVSLCVSSSSEVLPKYFNKYRHVAFATATLGVMIGIVVWPIVSHYLLSAYGYSKAMGMMAGVQVMHLVAGASFLPKEFCDEASTAVSEEVPSSWDVKNNPECQTEKDDVRKEEGKNHRNASDSNEKAASTDKLSVMSQLRLEFIRLFKSYKVWLILFHALLRNGTNTTFAVTINDFIVGQVGLSASTAAMGITTTGIGSIVGCVGVALTGTLKYDRLILHVCALTLTAIMTIILAFTTTDVMYYLLTGAWGVGQGATLATLLSVINRIGGSRHQAVLFGLVLFCQGIGSLAITQIFVHIGAVYGESYSLITAGITGILVNMLVMPLIVSNSREDSQAKEDLV